MDASVAVALIAAVASLVVAVVTAVLSRRERREEREAETEKVLERYRGPLLDAAFDLQNRLDNILNPDRDFLAMYGRRRHPRREDAVKSTLFRVGQYLCWVEIIRRDRLFLKLGEPEATRAVSELLGTVSDTFGDDRYGREFMLWREEQRAIGERMIDREGETASCVGYATFVERYAKDYARWFQRFEGKLERETAMSSARLLELRGNLRSLVAALDPEELRYQRSWEQASQVDG